MELTALPNLLVGFEGHFEAGKERGKKKMKWERKKGKERKKLPFPK